MVLAWVVRGRTVCRATPSLRSRVLPVRSRRRAARVVATPRLGCRGRALVRRSLDRRAARASANQERDHEPDLDDVRVVEVATVHGVDEPVAAWLEHGPGR